MLAAVLMPAFAPTRPLWLAQDRLTAQASAMVSLLENADAKGLNPDDYEGPEWAGRIRNLNAASAAAFDDDLTHAAAKYVFDMAFGRAGQNTADRWRYVEATVERLALAGDAAAVTGSLEPPFPSYRRTLAALAEYRRIAQLDDGEPLPIPAKAVRAGDEWPGFARVERLLRLTGDYAEGRDLAGAISRFQFRHGLVPDGTIGKSTVAEMNVPFAQRVRQIRLTLERWREAPKTFASPPIVVNIPEFGLHALDASYETAVAMKVVVGRALGHQTPLFEADMRYIIFNPWWEVPPGIAKRELAPKFARSPGTLRADGYEIVSSDGAVIARDQPTADAIAGLRSGRYRVRQEPGPKNALGGIKFMFPNAHNVYLHGTPATELFARTRRDFSHGCIRVERPEDLAAWVLRDRPEWTRAEIHAAVASGRTLQVNLTHPIPVLIVYGTVLAPESGEVQFFDDIYGLDEELDRQLKRIDEAGTAHEWNLTSRH